MKHILWGLVLLMCGVGLLWYFDGKLNRIDDVMPKLGIFCLAVACIVVGVFFVLPVFVAERSLERPAEYGKERF